MDDVRPTRDQPSLMVNRREFRSLLDALPAAAYTCDPSGLITYFNARAVQLWGREPRLHDPADRYCGSFKLFADDGSPIAHDQCWMAKALQTQTEQDGEEIIIERPDGTRATVLAHASPIIDDAGMLQGAVNVLVDISDRKQNEEAQARLAAIVESSEDAIISKTLEGRILTWNGGAETLLGYTADEAIGKSITFIIPPELESEEQFILSRLRRGERIRDYETVRVTKYGRRIDVSLRISPVRDSKGRIIGVSKILRDITLRKSGEQALAALKDELALELADLRRVHETSLRLSKTLELQPILDETLRTAASIQNTDMGLLMLCDNETDELRVAAALGLADAFVKAIEAIPAGPYQVCAQEARRVVLEDAQNEREFSKHGALSQSAGIRAVHATPLVTRSGKVVGVLATCFRRVHVSSEREKNLIDVFARQAVDFIENARLYSQLREAHRRKDEFLATLAHELRNPLAPISNSLNLLRLLDDLNPAAERVREIMERQVSHMVRLVDDLLEISRITRGKISLRKQTVELAAIVRSAVETSRPLIEAAGHQLAITLSAEPMTLDGDPVRLAQVISNLLNNAAKYTENSGQIWLHARRNGSTLEVSVRDNGTGIPADMLPRVFEMFAQVDTTLKRPQSGLGIGLTLARRLVEMHGGRIEAFSAGPGQGSEFVVSLPTALPPSARKAPSATKSRNDRPTLEPRRVLVVDDARDAAYVLSKMLEVLGQQVRVVNDPREAVREAIDFSPELIISDIAMPEMNGYELAREIRRTSELHGVVLVALTGYGQDSDRQLAREAGFDHHLVKPVSSDSLCELLSSLPTLRGAEHRG
jgi:PAS domain S-box-containing protein